MKPHVLPAAPGVNNTVCCPIAGFGMLRATPEDIAVWRRTSLPAPCNPLSVSLLKHADEQTVAGLAAVNQAIQQHGLTDTDFSEWGVVAAPSFLGRLALAATLQRIAVEGAWGVSPHFIPQHSLHAVSGTISQVLKIHGPNFGIEASPNGMADAMTVAATLMASGDLPGLWLVLTEYEPELLPLDPAKGSANGLATMPHCVALALALVPDASLSPEFMLRICPQVCATNNTAWTTWMPLESVGTLAHSLGHGLRGGRWRLGSHGWVELTTTELGPENGL